MPGLTGGPTFLAALAALPSLRRLDPDAVVAYARAITSAAFATQPRWS